MLRRHIALALALPTMFALGNAAVAQSAHPNAEPAKPAAVQPAAAKARQAKSTTTATPQPPSGDIVIAECRAGDPITGPVPIPRGGMTALWFQSGLQTAQSNSGNRVKAVVTQDTVLVHAIAQIVRRAVFGVNVTLPDGMPVAVPFQVDPDQPAGSTHYLVYTAQEYKALQQANETKQHADEARIQARIEQSGAERAKNARQEGYSAGVRNMLMGETYQLDKTSQLAAVSRQAPDSDEVAVVNVQAARTAGGFPDKFLLFSLDVTSPRATQAFQIAGVEVYDSRTMTQLSSEVLRIESAEGSNELPVSVAAAQRAKLYIATRLQDKARVPPLLIVLRQPAALPAFSMNIDEWEKDPLLRDIKRREDERKAAEAKRERDRALSKRTWIGAYGLGGVIWLEDGLPMTEVTDATSIKGLGIRVSWGLLSFEESATPLLSVDVDAAFGSTGAATFANVNVDGMQGDLHRTATLGRVHAGLALRRGSTLIPTLRAGLSVQGVSEDAELLTAAGPVPGPESSFDVTGGWYASGGIEARLGESFMAGMALTFIDAGGRRFLEAGLNLAYALGP